jgi:hypothetical protein
MSVLVVLIALALTGSIHQERSPEKTPKKGDTIVVKGCLKGSSLESTEAAILNSDATMMTALVYRLTGDKDLLKSMRNEHEGKVIEVTGVLKSTLPPANEMRGKTIGKTRITVGVGSSHIGSPARSEANRSIPVLEVKSYEGAAIDVRCGG